MNNHDLRAQFFDLSTPALADACLRLKLPVRTAPFGIRALHAESHIAGRALPVRHYGSVDVFLEVIGMGQLGDVMVIDNGGRTDEACIGDLTVLEAQAGGLAGIIVWGLHRDAAELARIDFPVFSYGALPAGPERLDPREPEAFSMARFGALTVTAHDVVFADANGVLFVSGDHVESVLATARTIIQKERQQGQAIVTGQPLRAQLQFDDYLAKRAQDAAYTFRRHLRILGGSVEE